MSMPEFKKKKKAKDLVRKAVTKHLTARKPTPLKIMLSAINAAVYI